MVRATQGEMASGDAYVYGVKDAAETLLPKPWYGPQQRRRDFGPTTTCLGNLDRSSRLCHVVQAILEVNIDQPSPRALKCDYSAHRIRSCVNGRYWLGHGPVPCSLVTLCAHMPCHLNLNSPRPEPIVGHSLAAFVQTGFMRGDVSSPPFKSAELSILSHDIRLRVERVSPSAFAASFVGDNRMDCLRTWPVVKSFGN